MLDLRPVSPIADYFVICSGESEPQIKAITDEIMERLEEVDRVPLGVEGVPASGWVLMDYGDVVIHIFDPLERQYYALEDLWKDAPLVVMIQ